jgi:hypothetical protein
MRKGRMEQGKDGNGCACLISAVYVFQAHDVVFAQVSAGLDFN